MNKNNFNETRTEEKKLIFIRGNKFERALVKFKEKKHNVKISAPKFSKGNTVLSTDFIFYRENETIKIFDRKCDHNGGKLISLGEKTICPLHGWEFLPREARYKNVNCEKKPLYIGKEIDFPIDVDVRTQVRETQNFSDQKQLSMRFINHACVIVNSKNIKFATDPWISGSAFSNGWWLQNASPADAYDELNSCDFIFISHNHPDHLHPESLKNLRKDMLFITANFNSGSSKEYLKDIGFANVIALDFDETIYSKNLEISFSVLKSGDFRDDSGLLFEIGKFKGIFGVDSNFLDFWRFPENLTFLATSFSSGASGFPLCFENFSNSEQMKIVERNKLAKKEIVRKTVEASQPKFYMPYAGFFTEKAKRDKDICSKNKKNKINEYIDLFKKSELQVLDVQKNNHFIFKGENLISASSISKSVLIEPSPEKQIETNYKIEKSASETDIRQYFENSSFYHPLDLKIILTDETFEDVLRIFFICFSKSHSPVFYEQFEEDKRRLDTNFLRIKIRDKEFSKVILNGLPWEDLSIGFQCRIYREPNVYNNQFWYHFTNIYVNNRVQRTKEPECLSCLENFSKI